MLTDEFCLSFESCQLGKLGFAFVLVVVALPLINTDCVHICDFIIDGTMSMFMIPIIDNDTLYCLSGDESG